ncbi:acyl carrier protein [Zhenhengia yiwuensis]|uniref:Acyl carrier protein n=1 Tax=Zhenhengia yiwuensis TaxID=2763666 RepID=A0A926IF82_9FIRM|nr:acyl carrier protein [Zhenhengia yiwuensis]MBC8580749.1 acyl carrier protein [Zhenhengia yiwuensis]
MSKDKIFEVVTGKIKEIINNSEMEITVDKKIESIGMNSIDFIRLLVFLEDTYDMEFSDDDLVIGDYEVIGDVIDKIYTMLEEV